MSNRSSSLQCTNTMCWISFVPLSATWKSQQRTSHLFRAHTERTRDTKQSRNATVLQRCLPLANEDFELTALRACTERLRGEQLPQEASLTRKEAFWYYHLPREDQPRGGASGWNGGEAAPYRVLSRSTALKIRCACEVDFL